MFEDLIGRLVGGAIWGLGTGIVLTVFRGDGAGVRPVARTLMKTSLAATDRVRSVTAEAREQLDDLRAEVQAERTSPADDAKATKRVSAQPKRSRA